MNPRAVSRTSTGRTAVLCPVDEMTLGSARFSDGFVGVFDGDSERMRWLLRGIAADAEGRVALAMDGGTVVGFLGLMPPSPGDRFFSVVPVLELAVVEVAVAYRRRGVFTDLFDAVLRDDLEERIVLVIADPAHRDRRESVRAFRDRLTATFGAFGFFPHPTDHPDVALHRDAVLLARIGRGVGRFERSAFFEALRRPAERPARVAVFLKDAGLRNLVRTDLERHDLEVVSVAPAPTPVAPVDVVVTGYAGDTGALVTIRVVDDDRVQVSNGVVHQPSAELDALPQLIRREIARRRYTRWPRSSKNAS